MIFNEFAREVSVKARWVFVLAALAVGSGAPGGRLPVLENVASAATGTGPGIFGVRINVSADTFDGACDAFDETAASLENFGTFAMLGALTAEKFAVCGPPRVGPYAEGSVAVAEHPVESGTPKTAWKLHAEAASSGEGEGEAESDVHAVDTFTVFTTGTNQAQVFLHIRVDGAIAGNPSGAFGDPFVEYEVFTHFRRFRPDGSREFFFAPFRSPIFRHADGLYDDTADLELPPVDSGTQLLMSTGFLFAYALSNGTGIQNAGATAEFSLCSHDPKVTLLSASGLTGDCPPEGDLKVVSVAPVQSVFGASMIARKDTVVAVDVANTFDHDVVSNLDITVSQGGVELGRFREFVTVPGNCPGGKKRFFIPDTIDLTDACEPSESASGLASFGLAPAAGGGEYVVSVTMTPVAGADSNPGNDQRSSDPLLVKETELSVLYVAIDCGALGCGTLAPGEFETAIRASNKQIKAMFPIAPDGFAGSACMAGGMPCTVPAINGTSEGAITIDATRVERLAKKSGVMFDRIIALVPTGYLQAHRNADGSPVPDSANGATPTLPGRVSLVRAAAVTGSKWGVAVPVTNGCSRIAREVAPFAGDLMSQSLTIPVPLTPPDVWIAKADYATIIDATKTNPDPALLGIVSTISRTDVVTIDEMIEMPVGRVFRLQPAGSYSVDLLDAAGNILEHDSFEPSFRMLIEGGTDFDTNENIVSPDLPYALSTARVEYRHAGKLLLAVDPLARTLHDAILSLPDRAYEREPAQRRKALLEKVDAFEKMLAGRHLVAARNKLNDDIRDKVAKWIVTYVAGTSELSKESVLERIATLDTRIKAQTDYPGK